MQDRMDFYSLYKEKEWAELRKRCIALVLAFVMTLGCVPTAAFSEGMEESVEEVLVVTEQPEQSTVKVDESIAAPDDADQNGTENAFDPEENGVNPDEDGITPDEDGIIPDEDDAEPDDSIAEPDGNDVDPEEDGIAPNDLDDGEPDDLEEVPKEAGDPDEEEPKDITEEVILSLDTWWYQSEENTIDTPDYSGILLKAGETVSAGVSMHISAEAVRAEDWFAIALPTELRNFTVIGNENVECTVNEDGTLKVEFLKDGDFADIELPLSFQLSSGESCTFEAGESYTIRLPQKQREPKDLTEDIALTNWWHTSPDNTQTSAEQYAADYSNVTLEVNAAMDRTLPAGVSVHIPMDCVVAGDSFSMELPAELQNVTLSVNDGDVEYTLESGVLTVTFLKDCFSEENMGIDLPLNFELPIGNSCEIKAGDDTYPIKLPTFTKNIVSAHVSNIDYVDTVDDIDWSPLVRPLEFNEQSIQITAYYPGGESRTYSVQDLVSTDQFYLKFIHDGNGGGSFDLVNIPNYDRDDPTIPVLYYEISVNTDALPAYSCAPASVVIPQENLANGEMLTWASWEMVLQTQTLSLQPEVGKGDPADFTFHASFTNPTTEDNSGYSTAEASLALDVTVSSGSAKEVSVPAGLHFSITQEPTDGYRLIDEYTVVTNPSTSTDTDEPMSGAAVGDVESGYDLEVHTMNYAQNLTKSFTVEWVDNYSASRPSLTAASFVLQYRTEDGEWAVLDSDAMATLGISKLPGFYKSLEKLGIYTYTGLPSVDLEGSELEYRVILAENYEGKNKYTAEAVYAESDTAREDPTGFVFSEKITFTATVSWRDGSNVEGHRPQVSDVNTANGPQLHLYRRMENGAYELVEVPDEWITAAGNTWRISVPDLPRFGQTINPDDGKKVDVEYDYVLVQGAISGTTVTPQQMEYYKTYYLNSVGNYGDDTSLCHNQGTIIEKTDYFTTFTATKKWNDDGNQDRGTPTVTLWRYSIPETGSHDIDTMFDSNKAAPVVYHYTKTQSDGSTVPVDIVLSYQLDGTDNQTIEFNSQTVEGLPGSYRLPMYDENGQKYVYFVRESSDSQDYAVNYLAQAGTDAEDNVAGAAAGAGDAQFVSNTRREKALVNVNLEWKAPANLADLNTETKVKLKIMATDSHGYLQELTVYSPLQDSYAILQGDALAAATTITGFDENISVLDLSFYVNIYDDYGYPFDMSEAVVQQISIVNDGNEVTWNDDGTFKLGPDVFLPKSAYAGSSEEEGAVSEYSYKVTNTITGERTYSLVKKWQAASITEDQYKDIDRINFTLTRRSSRVGASTETVDTYSVPNPRKDADYTALTKDKNQNEYWTELLENLEKYDPDGYAYIYEAKEVSYTQGENTVLRQNSGWAVYYTRTEDQTIALNYISTTSYPAMWYNKIWVDNGDSTAHGKVYIRAYRKADVRAALEAMGEVGNDTMISLDSPALASVGFFPIELSSENNWLAEHGLASIEKAATGQTVADPKALKYEDYIALEYKVIDGHVGEYSYAQLWQATDPSEEVYTITGSVVNTQRQYVAESEKIPGSNMIVLTNTRTGQVSLEIDKFWKDEGTGRPTVSFQIYREGAPFHPGTPEAQPLVISAQTGSTVEIQQKDLLKYMSSNGVITIQAADEPTPEAPAAQSEEDPDADEPEEPQEPQPSTVVVLLDLPLFSSEGVRYSYNVEEITPAGYSSERGGTYAQEDPNIPDKLAYTYEFINTRTGLTEHIAYKEWNDLASGGEDRPDLFFTLYQYLQADAAAHPDTAPENLASAKKYTDRDPVMVPLKDGTPVDPSEDIPVNGINEAEFDWKVIAARLPAFDENGQSYGYKFVETMSSSENGFGVYEQHFERKTVTVGEAAEVVDVYTNTLSGTTTISGDKVWANLEGYFISPDDLPSPQMLLYRSSYKVQLTEDNIETLLANNEIELVATSYLNAQKDKYAFPDEGMTPEEIAQAVEDGYLVEVREGSTVRYELPKYDEHGGRYYYSVWEQLDSLIAEQLYTKMSATGTMTNTFRKDVNRRSIAVTKTWANRDYLTSAHKKFPPVTYVLYRYMEGQNPQQAPLGDAIEISRYTIPATDFVEGEPYTYVFTDLLTYSPSGILYHYYVKEEPINGYSIEHTNEDGVTENKTDYSDVLSTQGALSTDSVSNVSTKNTYTPSGKIDIKGQKRWDDYANNADISGGLRPEGITLTVTRSTSGSDSDVSNAPIVLVENKADADSKQNKYWIEWKTTATGDYWEYTIHGLEKYAPNGLAYVYTVKEEVPEGFKALIAQRTVNAGSYTDPDEEDDDTNAAAGAGPLTNKFTATYTVRKNWLDGNNRYGLRPDTVTVVLERAAENTANAQWERIPWTLAESYEDFTKLDFQTDLPCVVDENGSTVVGVVLSAAQHELLNTKGNSWQYIFRNLPEFNKDGEKFYYRCQEIKIGNSFVEEDDSGLRSAGSYVLSEVTYAEGKTTLLNILHSTKLVIDKKWQEDEKNLYSSRPASLQFKLQMRGYEIVKDENGEDVYNYTTNWKDIQVDGQTYFTIYAKDNWHKELEDLPVATTDESGNRYYAVQFRAVEKSTEGKPEGALNYLEKTSYALTSADHDLVDDYNVSNIQNRLIHNNMKKIVVQKVWRQDEHTDEIVTATFELLYHKVGETSWHCFGDPEVVFTEDGYVTSSEHAAGAKCVRQSVTTQSGTPLSFTWDNLPMYDLQGNELEFKVVEYDIEGYATHVVFEDTEEQLPAEEDPPAAQADDPDDNEDPDDDDDEPGEQPSGSPEETPPAQPETYTVRTFTFTNIEEQSYTVSKRWVNETYAQCNKDTGEFTATFLLEQRIGSGEWTTVEFADETVSAEVTLSTQDAKATLESTWNDLPKYTVDGEEITYRARETAINGIPVDETNSNGAYIVTYLYDEETEPAHAGVKTEAVNRMVYGFVNLQKTAAYLTPDAEADGMLDATFAIYAGTDLTADPYIPVVKTKDGNLVCNEDGTYGEGEAAKYLISGEYTLVETGTDADYSIWSSGIRFTVGKVGGETDTGEHGTAWISTTGTDALTLHTDYLHAEGAHSENCTDCAPTVWSGETTAPAYNLESRGVFSFTKTDLGGNPIDAHSGANAESKAWFGVYLEDETTLVAYMAATDANDPTSMELTTVGPNAGDAEIDPAVTKNEAGVPYLRTDAPYTLLSGTYVVKELVPPAGYILDTVSRTMVIDKLEKNLDTPYSENPGSFQSGTPNEWKNTENQLMLYKRDQYGRKVTLAPDGYLELNALDSKFLTGENTIRLYQNSESGKACADCNGDYFSGSAVPNICYDEDAECWIITGLLDAGKKYSVSEPEDAVPENHIQADTFEFTMDDAGVIHHAEMESAADPLSARGDNFSNAYHSAVMNGSTPDNNIIVLRDPARYRKNVVLEKYDGNTLNTIPDIAFGLYVNVDTENGVQKQSVLEENVYLVTDENGQIDLTNLKFYLRDVNGTLKKVAITDDDYVRNVFTQCDLKYGLDVGTYFFVETEYGASDSYRLLGADDVQFTVAVDPDSPNEDGTADVSFAPNAVVSQTAVNADGRVKNTPVDRTILLDLTKKDNQETLLQGAKFALDYTSMNDGDDGAQEHTVYECVTDANGVLTLVDGSPVDISRKGTYILTETQAPDGYMTRTDSGATTPIPLLQFKVDTNNLIPADDVETFNGSSDLILTSEVSTKSTGETTYLSLTMAVNNEKTVVSAAKLDDLVSGMKTGDQKNLNGGALTGAELRIYEGIVAKGAAESAGTPKWTNADALDESTWEIPLGTLKEKTIYTLYEANAPTGFLEADPIYFMLFGTKTVGNQRISQLYVFINGVPTVGDEEDWDKWDQQTNIKNNKLTLVDEIIIAPLDLQKIRGSETVSYAALKGAVFEIKSLDGSIVLGEAVTDSEGFLTWKSIASGALDRKLIYNKTGKLAVSDEDVFGGRIILQQNTSGYQVTETDAPANAYVVPNTTFTVEVTAADYVAYHVQNTEYRTNQYVDIMNPTSGTLTTRADNPDKDHDLVNPPFEAEFRMYKYDAEHPELANILDFTKVGMEGVQFTLSMLQPDGVTYEEVTDSPFTTGANGLLTIPISLKGTYKLVESETVPEGYDRNPKEMIFTVLNEDYQKTLTYSDDTERHTLVLAEGDTPYALPNTRRHGTVTLMKQDKDSAAKLDGVRYILERVTPDRNMLVDHWFPASGEDGNKLTVETGYTYTVVASATTEQEYLDGITENSEQPDYVPGYLVIEDLQWGTYTLTEIQEKDGYILDSNSYTFVISSNGLEQEVTNTEEGYFSNTKNQVTIRKTDGADILQNAEFVLYPVIDGIAQLNSPAEFFMDPADEDSTDDQVIAGVQTIHGLKEGSYVLRETLAPEGYELARDVFFTMERDGSVSTAVACTVAGNGAVTTEPDGAGVVTLTQNGISNLLEVKDIPIQITLTKVVDKVGEEEVDLSYRESAEYTIKGIFANGTDEETRTFTGNDIQGIAKTDPLYAQLVGGRTYAIRETKAPAGYAVQKESREIYVDFDGTVWTVNGETHTQENGFLRAQNVDGIGKLFYHDDPIELDLEKWNATGEIDEETLGYAKFKITGKLVNEATGEIETGSVVMDLQTDTFRNLLTRRLIGEETYVLEETYAPKGYKLAAKVTFTLDKFGQIVSCDSGQDPATLPGTVVRVTDEPIEAFFRKIDEDGPLAGVSFTLTHEDKESDCFVNISDETKPDGFTDWTSNKITWTTTGSEDGTGLICHLIANVPYRLHENSRIFNHEIMDQDILFYMDENGVMHITQNSTIPNNTGDAALVDTQGILMTIRNPIIQGKVELQKFCKDSTAADTPLAVQNKQYLAGAVYQLFKVEGETQTQTQTIVRAVENSGSYAYSAAGGTGTTDRYVTDAQGKIVITGLPEGMYRFLEIDAPKAYHINNDASDYIEFEIHEDERATKKIIEDTNISADLYMDARINAKISLNKLSDVGEVNHFKFDVRYRASSDEDYVHIAYITKTAPLLEQADYSLADGAAELSGVLEGLRRGEYELEELSADDQMLNTLEIAVRNIIRFSIGNECNHVYELNSALDDYVKQYDTNGVWVSDSGFIELTAQGVQDTYIPRKKVSVTKHWVDDNGMELTFQPESVTVELYRTANNETELVPNSRQPLSADTAWSYEWTELPAYVNLGGDTQITYLYSYFVKEIDPVTNTEVDSGKWWYDVSYPDVVNDADTYQTGDGNSLAVVKNTLDGGSESKELVIRKKLGGGSAEDTFQVRVLLTDADGNAVGNKGWYLDPCTIYDAEGVAKAEPVTPNDDGWMTIRGGESIYIKLPAGVHYQVVEKTEDGDAELVNTSSYAYIPRYDSDQSGVIPAGTAQAPETTVQNAVHKFVQITKQNENGEALSGAVFSVEYQPNTADTVNPTAAGPAMPETDGFTLDAAGFLLMPDSSERLDITARGTYTIRETRAPQRYITPTDNEGKPIILAAITVGLDDIMTVAVDSETNAALLVKAAEVTDNGSVAAFTVMNEPTQARFGKTIDYAAILQGADAEEGTYLAGIELAIWDAETPQTEAIVSWTTGGSFYTTEASLLQENHLYRLTEAATSVPTGYRRAADIYFKLDGTYTDTTGRYSRVVICNADGTAADQNLDGSKYGTPGVVSGKLNMVDETIIAPVDLRKVLKTGTSTWEALPGVEFTVYAGETKLGTAVTGAYGYLTWDSIEAGAYALHLIYDADGKILTSGGTGMAIILQKNEDGYTFLETEAPEHVFNNDLSYTVTISEQMYLAYRTDAVTGDLYDTTKYVNAVSPSGTLSVRDNNKTFGSDSGMAENLPYQSTVTLHKYDADEEANKKPIPGTRFLLYRDAVAEGNIFTEAYSDGVLHEDGIFETDSNGNLSIVIPKKGTYFLVEMEPAVNYKEWDGQLSFELRDKVTPDEHAQNIFGDDHGGRTNTLQVDENGVPNTRMLGSVKLTKTDAEREDGLLLNGVVYTLTRTDTPDIQDYLLKTPLTVVTGNVYTPVKTDAGWTWTEEPGEDGVILVKNLNWGSYKLEETRELSGYVQAENVFTFTVNDAETHTLDFEDADVNHKNKVTFYKSNVIDAEAGALEEKGLEGAVFEVHAGMAGSCENCAAVPFYASANDHTTVTTVTSGENGIVDVYGLPTYTLDEDGNVVLTPTYHLKEITPPKGYKLQTQPVEFTIDRDGTVKVNSAAAEKVTMTDDPIKLYIDKIGESETKPLSGAVFQLKDVCAADCDHTLADEESTEITLTMTSDSILIPIETVIADHTYRLTEMTAPEGYKCTAVVEFTVHKDGTAEIVSQSGGYNGKDSEDSEKTIQTAALNPEKTHIRISNELIRLSLVKQDFDNDAVKLAGVKFKLEPDENSAFAADFASPQTYTTDANGKISFQDGLLKHDNVYILTETDRGSNTSYRFAQTESLRQTKVKVAHDGTITLEGPTPDPEHQMFECITMADGNPRVVVRNEKIKLTISKVDQVSQEPLAGVTLKLSRNVDGDFDAVYIPGLTEEDGTWITTTDPITFKAVDAVPASDDSAAVDAIPFPSGVYRLEEISTPIGHNLLQGSLEFTISKTGLVTSQITDGNFSLVNPEDGAYGGITLTVFNPAYTDLKITKESPGGRKLGGVEFRMKFRQPGGDFQFVELVTNEAGKLVVNVDETTRIPAVGTASTSKLTTDANGIAIFANLPDGVYELTELKTVSGYNLLSQPLIITIDRVADKFTWKSGTDGQEDSLTRSSADGNILPITVINREGFSLPATGVVTPQLPKAILGITAFLEGLVLFLYQRNTKKRRRGVNYS